jgi:hypothetical protein
MSHSNSCIVCGVNVSRRHLMCFAHWSLISAERQQELLALKADLKAAPRPGSMAGDYSAVNIQRMVSKMRASRPAGWKKQ